jgi:hypothetical protein
MLPGGSNGTLRRSSMIGWDRLLSAPGGTLCPRRLRCNRRRRGSRLSPSWRDCAPGSGSTKGIVFLLGHEKHSSLSVGQIRPSGLAEGSAQTLPATRQGAFAIHACLNRHGQVLHVKHGEPGSGLSSPARLSQRAGWHKGLAFNQAARSIGTPNLEQVQIFVTAENRHLLRLLEPVQLPHLGSEGDPLVPSGATSAPTAVCTAAPVASSTRGIHGYLFKRTSGLEKQELVFRCVI